MQNKTPKNIILIGASTGGPSLISSILSVLPKMDDLSIIIAQHMSEEFIHSFSDRLNLVSKNPIYVCTNDMPLEASCIYFCHKNTQIKQNGFDFTFSVRELSGPFSYNPNISAILSSFATFSKKFDITTFILTGIGDDGVSGAIKLVKNGSKVVTQTSECAIVDGMPSRIRESVSEAKICSNEEIKNMILKIASSV